ncbi:MAG: SAM-dependent methyltransferase [Flavobacteriales bacterium]|nr:SAM-dependent methyltransferase [Flavobacteriales bacterium]|tara:strand:- start:26272 stop:27051 length:780 start_codon:yes stop_codon:yes gene_type:complete
MQKKVQFAGRYFKYWLYAKQDTNSEFVNGIVKEVLQSNQKFYSFKEIEGIRSVLKKNNSTIKITDYGAGSSINKSKERKISDLVKHSAKAPWLGEVLFRLVNKFEPQNMLELGTSLGISACYQIGANKKANFTTMEGCPETAKIARKVLKNFNAENVKIKVGDFSNTLSEVIDSYEELDYVFFDGNHQKKPTIEYFDKCLKKAHENSIFIFDDIHWSNGMEEAWKHIQAHPLVTCSIDLFWIGIIFFKKDHPKENFIVR